MVKLTGPGMAARASGSLADTITFSNWKEKAYLKMKPKPKQPETPPQIAMRAIMLFLSSQWETLTPQRKDTWREVARPFNISPFNAYNKINLPRARNNLAPSQIDPPLELELPSTIIGHAATGGTRTIDVTFNVTMFIWLWGVKLHLVPADGAPLLWQKLRYIVPTPGAGVRTYRLTEIPPGVKWIAFQSFNQFAGLNDDVVYKSATVNP